MSNLIRRYTSIEVIILQQGQTQIPDQTQLRGCFIDGIVVLPKIISLYSAVTGKSTVATNADLSAMTLSLQRASDNVIQNIPMLALNPYTSYDNTIGNTLLRELFLPQYIDFNQSSIYMATTPSNTTVGVTVSLGIYYYNPNKEIVTA